MKHQPLSHTTSPVNTPSTTSSTPEVENKAIKKIYNMVREEMVRAQNVPEPEDSSTERLYKLVRRQLQIVKHNDRAT